MHSAAVRALKVLMSGEEPLVVALQNVAEFWNVATRPVLNNGLGFTIEEAQREVIRLEEFFEVLSESPESYAAWKALLIAHRVSGVQVHDARLVAVMKTYGVWRIVTFNLADFVRFTEIEAIHPEGVAERR